MDLRRSAEELRASQHLSAHGGYQAECFMDYRNRLLQHNYHIEDEGLRKALIGYIERRLDEVATENLVLRDVNKESLTKRLGRLHWRLHGCFDHPDRQRTYLSPTQSAAQNA